MGVHHLLQHLPFGAWFDSLRFYQGCIRFDFFQKGENYRVLVPFFHSQCTEQQSCVFQGQFPLHEMLLHHLKFLQLKLFCFYCLQLKWTHRGLELQKQNQQRYHIPLQSLVLLLDPSERYLQIFLPLSGQR